KCASIEFLAGKMVVHTGENMPVMVLANTTYTESVKRWKADADARNGGSDSVSRFIRAADMVSAHDAGISRPPVDYAFDILSRVASRTRTQWRIVYEQTNGRIHFTTRTNKKMRRVDLRRFDFSCGAPAGVLDVNEGPAGDVTGKFRDYTRKANRDLIGASFGKTWFLRNIPAESLDIISRYPDGMTCEP
ncbi:MAG: hypothetical protein GY859_42340, partial [Desulfobacterales bacterium]|nr:hypothetical protein [Desulfobacterales bacterium]